MAPAATSPALVARLECAANCGAAGAVRPGSLLRIRGRSLTRVREVVFAGVDGEADDVAAATVARRRTSADVRVPFGAVSGPVVVVDGDGAQSAPSVAPVAVEATPPGPAVELGVRAPRGFFGAAQPPTLSYVVHGPGPAEVAVDLVRLTDGVVVARWDAAQVAADVEQRVVWDGLSAGRVQRTGRYAFRVTVGGVAQPPAAFDFARDRFPILGPHHFGNGFGAGRGHDGLDIFAACGTPLVAAHGGIVKLSGFHARAGNYVVIDNAGTGSDYAYMHLRDAPLVAAGTHVFTGQPIGFVGATGAASGCHLHFETWTAPGWYAGGRPVDPGPALRSWLGRR
jgi:murein DD-endopeptidase MepM/ murein hydrolase activator NlpD